LVLVVGTGTDVGKTWLSARLLEQWRADGVAVAARKPAQSFLPGEDDDASTDAHVLAAATDDEPDAVCPSHRWYPVAMAPPIAASVLGRDPISIIDLVAELVWPPGTAIGIVETAGGVRSPQADDGDCVSFIDLLDPDEVIVVADAGLGTINAVALSCEALATAAHTPRLTVFLNRFDEADEVHRRNRSWLVERAAIEAVTDVSAVAAGVRVAAQDDVK